MTVNCRCVAGDEALEKQKKENVELKKKVENAQAAMMELTQENQSLQVRLSTTLSSQSSHGFRAKTVVINNLFPVK